MKSAGAPAPAPEPKHAELAKDEEADRKSGGKTKALACKVVVTVDKAERAGDTQDLRALIERTARLHGCQATGALKLRITLDGAGKISSVVLVSGDGSAGKALVRKLTGATSATQAKGQAAATVEVTVTVEST